VAGDPIGASNGEDVEDGPWPERPIGLRRLAGQAAVVSEPRSVAARFTLVFAERGRGIVAVTGITRALAAGEICFGDAGLCVGGQALYGWRLSVDAGWLGHPAGELIGDGLASPSRPTIRVLDQRERSRCSVFFGALADELERGGGDPIALRALVELLVLGYARAAPSLPGGGALARVKSERLAAEVLDVIDERFSERLSLADVADELARAPASVARSVREVTGRSVLELIVERRMEEAQALLAGSDLSVAEVAFRVGYPSAGYFHRVFRRFTGVTPQRWRTAAAQDERELTGDSSLRWFSSD
jgi:AraC-like DNA-binding protein